MYVDPIVNEIHPSFRETFGFTPVDESLLSPVFQDKSNRIELKEFNKLLWLPSPEILLATKIKSVPNRTRDEKLIKDICDIYALNWYSGKNFKKLKDEAGQFLDERRIEKLQVFIESEKDVFQKAQTAMDIDAETIKNLFEKLLT